MMNVANVRECSTLLNIAYESNIPYLPEEFLLYPAINFPLLNENIPNLLHMECIYISQLIRFARVCSHVNDSNSRNKTLHHDENTPM